MGAHRPDLCQHLIEVVGFRSLQRRELESFIEFPPLQAPETYNLDQVLAQVRAMSAHHPSE